MIDLTGVTHHPAIDEIVGVLCNKTQNTDRSFFNAEVAYFLGKIASNMRVTILTKDRGEIPVNIYALALATSGYGKGHSVHIMENEFIMDFKKRFMNETMPTIADKNLWYLANERAARDSTDPQTEYDSLMKDYTRAGNYAFTFDSGSTPAVKQLRQKLLYANCGSINLQIDEIGSNLVGNVEVLNTFLELYDQGTVKQKLTKNTHESIRAEEMDGKTPTNALLFGTPIKLFDGGQTEDQFYSFLETGYARRCIFGLGFHNRKAYHTQTAAEIYHNLIQPSNNTCVQKWSDLFFKLADPALFNWKLYVDDPVGILLLDYKISCEKAADLMADHEEIKKAELSHRYFKALKLAGAYAFCDMSSEITMDHLKQAILLVEQSGEAFQSILSREKSYVKLAKYIAASETEVTHADLHEALPFYKTGVAARNEMITLASAWGIKKHIVIKKSYVDGIEFFSGETLKETNLNELIVSYSDHWAYNYNPEVAPFDQLHVLTQQQGMHWSNHHFKNNHRQEENTKVGFNTVVLDVDGGVNLNTVHELLKGYKFMTYTTKRHTPGENRFRVILPINYILELDSEDYKEFMNNVMEWVPFKSDESANQRSKKWETFEGGSYHYNPEGETLDALKFIPKTSKNEHHKKSIQSLGSLDNLERWFAQQIATGNRNNQMLKYAMALVDSGMTFDQVTSCVKSFNSKINNPLDAAELDKTILVSVAKKYTN